VLLSISVSDPRAWAFRAESGRQLVSESVNWQDVSQFQATVGRDWVKHSAVTLSVNWSQRTYSWVPITQTLANSNLALARTKINFPWISFINLLTVILPSGTRTLDNSTSFPERFFLAEVVDNSNLLLTRSNFCFPSDHFYKIFPSITRTMFWALKKSGKNSELASETKIIMRLVKYHKKQSDQYLCGIHFLLFAIDTINMGKPVVGSRFEQMVSKI